MGEEQLSKEDLNTVWDLYRKEPERKLRDKLITNYLRLVKYVLGRMAVTLPSHVRVEDMYSTGIMGLIKAIEKYETGKNAKFETYAILLIRGAIIDEMRSLDWVPRSVHQKANMISQAENSLRQKMGREPSDAETAKYLKMDLKDFEILVERVRPAVFIPLNEPSREDSDQVSLAEKIPDHKMKTSYEAADYNEFRKLLEKAVMELPEQERTVLVLYYYENLMLKEIGKVIGVSESRVSQIHTKAVIRLRGRLKDFSTEFMGMF
jgi:RNA polymerase sigma factor for flagellar operon FliA